MVGSSKHIGVTFELASQPNHGGNRAWPGDYINARIDPKE